MQDDPRETVRRLAALAGMTLPEERIAALVPALAFAEAGLAALAGGGGGPADGVAGGVLHGVSPRTMGLETVYQRAARWDT